MPRHETPGYNKEPRPQTEPGLSIAVQPISALAAIPENRGSGLVESHNLDGCPLATFQPVGL
jgi:hypothetical protein